MSFFNRSKHKYGAKRVEKAGLSFDSKAESRYHDELLLREKAGEIEIEKLQDRVHLTAGVHLIVDFRIKELSSGEVQWHEYKGFETPEWRIKRRLWKQFGPGPLHIRYATKSEIIIPVAA